MSMKKIQDILLETTAKYQEKSKLNVRFWNQDKDTAELRFIITRDNFPLSLSSENVKIIIALESGDNFIASDEFVIDTEVDGVARFAIPNDFMSVATNVTGQIYVGTLDDDEVIVQRQFEFTVSDDLLSSIPTEEKIRYIKMFDDLRAEIKSIVSGLQEDLANMNDYVSQVNQATQDGLTALTNLIKQKQDAYNANHTAKMKELNDKGAEYSNKFDNDKKYIDDAQTKFTQSVNGSGLVTTGQSSGWQKYKLTNDNGTLITLHNFDFNNIDTLETGNYFLNVSYNSPFKGTSYGYLKIEKVTNSSRKATANPGNSNQYYVKYKWKDEWSDWYELVTAKDATQIETITESQNKANTAENNANTYTDTKVSAQRAVLFSGSVNGVGKKIDLTESMDNYSILIVSGRYAGGNFDEVIVVSNIGSGHPIQRVNLSNPTATGAIIYEMELTKDSNTRFNIIRDNYYGIASGEATMNANSFTINKIEAIK